MSILILGGQGNLGSQLVKVFNPDYEIIAWDHSGLDVLDFNLLTEKVRELKPEVIINTVAYNAVDKCEDSTEYPLAFETNSKLVGVLADLALEQEALFVHYSSDYVFSGIEEKQFFTEEETPNPINKYGDTKASGEREIISRAELGLKYYLIRTSKLFGPQGSSPNSKAIFFDIMLKLAQTKKEISVVREELSCFTYTPDLANATLSLYERKYPYGIYHFINEEACSWYEAAKVLFTLTKTDVSLRAVRSEDVFRSARRPKFSILANTKFKKLPSFRSSLKVYLHNSNDNFST